MWEIKWEPKSYPLKIAGRKHPALVDPSHKIHQGGKGMLGMDRRMDGQMDTSSPLPAHFRSLPVHFRSIWEP